MTFWRSAAGSLTQLQKKQSNKSGKRHCFLVTFLILSDLYFIPICANFRPKLEVVGARLTPGKVIGKPVGAINSPIFYLKLASNLRNSINTSNNNNRHSAHAATASSYSSGSHLPRRNSNLYKLPLQFVSNAKPVDIIHGITRNTRIKLPQKTITKLYKPSKVLYLSTKYVSNAKPIRPYIKQYGMKRFGFKRHHSSKPFKMSSKY